LSLSGIISVLFYALHVIFGTLNYPDYNWLRQAVSDLTAIDSPSFITASRFSTLYGALSCFSCVFVYLVIQRHESKMLKIGIALYAKMNWISFIGYTLFPLSSSGYMGTFQDVMHLYVVTISVILLSIASLVLIIISGFRKKNHLVLGICALLALMFMFIGSIGTGVIPEEYFGLLERFSIYSVVTFTGIISIWGFNYSKNE